MPVNSRQALFSARMEEWQRCRDAVAGADAVKARGETYLPRLGGQGIVHVVVPGVGSWDVDEYESYKTRATWDPSSGEAVKEMLGALFRTPIVTDVPDVITAHLDDITMTGEAFQSFAQRLATEVLTVGFFGVLVDLPADTQVPRPYWIGYRAENILRAMLVNRDGIWVLGQVVLEETTLEPGDDEFEEEEVTRWRVLELDAEGFLVVRRFELVSPSRPPVEVSTAAPNVRGRRLQGIPFQTFGPRSLLPVPEASPILHIVDLNLAHYRADADYREALHYLAVPTPWAAGFPIGTEMRLGARIAHVTDNPQGSMHMLEFTGAGLGELCTALDRLEAQMARGRAQLLSLQKGGIESAEALRLRSSPGQNVLMTLAHTMSEGLSNLLTFHSEWMGLRNVAASAVVNDDFVDNTLEPAQQAENRADYQARLISYATWHWRSAKGELLRPDVDAEQEMAEIEAEQPLGGELELPADENEETPETEDVA